MAKLDAEEKTLENVSLQHVELPELATQILTGVAITSQILDFAQFGTIEAERNFLENNVNLRNAELEKVNNEKKDKNIERTVDGVEIFRRV